MMEFMSDDNFVEKLIFQVQENESIYNKKHKLYYNRLIRKNVWEKIATTLGKKVQECQGRWKLLRERFVKEIRKHSSRSGAEAIESQWPYMENLMFLKEYIQPKSIDEKETYILPPVTESDTSNEFDENIANVSYSFSSGNSSKRVKTATINSTLEVIEEAASAIKNRLSTNNEVDVDESFCRTLVGLLKEIPENRKDDARTKLFLYVMQLKKDYSIKRGPS